MNVELSNATRSSGLDTRALKRDMAALLTAVGEPDAGVSLAFVRDPAIQALNRDYRGKDRPTDVLSFEGTQDAAPDGPAKLLGDIVISLDTARRQAADYDASLQDEVRRLLIHGLLHLLGHDHHEPGERARMRREERRLARVIGVTWP